ncbi:2-dehydropantoate 2-reductase [Ectobacillus funiculus]|uniref:2-dehydropantoate 2-reductase n=1 Tax=Ectobacillus funiculus TaxID=137993 RepID=A0ABV5WPL3_9BACI
MKIGVIGPGAIGMLFAFYLQKAGASVTIYTRSMEQAEHISRFGISCNLDGQVETQFPDAVPLGAIAIEDDYVFVAVKQYDIGLVLPHLQRTQARFVFLQNGMGHLSLLQNMQQKCIAVGIVEHGARKETAGSFVHTGMGVTKLGILAGEEEFQALLPLFQAPYFPILVEKNWEEVLRSKLIVNACINPLTALYRVRNGVLLTNPAFHNAMKQVFSEVIFVLDEKEERWEHVCNVCRKTAENQSSMLTDVKLGRETEIDAIIGYLLMQAEKQNKQVPLLAFLQQSIKGLAP